MLDAHDGAIEKLQAFVAFYRKAYASVLERGGCAIMNTAIDADDTHPGFKRIAAGALLDWKARIEAILDEGIRKKEIRPIATEPWACRMIAMIEGSILLAKTTQKSQFMMINLDYLDSEILKLAF